MGVNPLSTHQEKRQRNPGSMGDGHEFTRFSGLEAETPPFEDRARRTRRAPIRMVRKGRSAAARGREIIVAQSLDRF